MSFWTFVFLCVITGIGYDIWHKQHLAKHGHVLDHKGRLKPTGQPPATSPREAELEAELGELRERVKVLERIATDEARPLALAREIESLRDSPRDGA